MKAYIAIAPLALLVFTGCGEDKEGALKAEMPEVSAENCTIESIRVLASDIQQDFSGLCLRRSSYKESIDQEW